MKNQKPIKLQKPGAGLPFIESLIIKYYYGCIIANQSSPQDSLKTLEHFTNKILKLISEIDPNYLEKPILIPRLPGIEDSSRFWSIAMTLEHLVIVGKNVKDVILQLSNEITPEIKVDIAKVKPLGSLSYQESLKLFKDLFLNMQQELSPEKHNFNSKAQLHHPWLGSANAKKWLWLLGTHQGIHYKQIKEIKKIIESAKE